MSAEAILHQESDTHLVRHASTDAQARDVLVRRLSPRVRRLTGSFLRNAADADDAAQVALVEILKAAPSYRGEGAIEAWADRITARVAIRMARSRRLEAVRHETTDGTESLVGDLPSESPSVEGLPRSVLAYLDALPEVRRTVLVLRHVLDYSIAEIAEATGVSENTVKDRLLSARDDVRKLVRRDLASVPPPPPMPRGRQA
jgi:RNA polymerase sigma-70 factor (ECF subfamily)